MGRVGEVRMSDDEREPEFFFYCRAPLAWPYWLPPDQRVGPDRASLIFLVGIMISQAEMDLANTPTGSGLTLRFSGGAERRPLQPVRRIAFYWRS